MVVRLELFGLNLRVKVAIGNPLVGKLTPEEVIESYGLRRSMESRFNQLQLAGGMKEAWQPTRPTLHRWVQITMIGYG